GGVIGDHGVGRVGGHVVALEDAARLEHAHDLGEEPVAVGRLAPDDEADAVEDARAGREEAVGLAHDEILVVEVILFAAEDRGEGADSYSNYYYSYDDAPLRARNQQVEDVRHQRQRQQDGDHEVIVVDELHRCDEDHIHDHF